MFPLRTDQWSLSSATKAAWSVVSPSLCLMQLRYERRVPTSLTCKESFVTQTSYFLNRPSRSGYPQARVRGTIKMGCFHVWSGPTWDITQVSCTDNTDGHKFTVYALQLLPNSSDRLHISLILCASAMVVNVCCCFFGVAQTPLDLEREQDRVWVPLLKF